MDNTNKPTDPLNNPSPPFSPDPLTPPPSAVPPTSPPEPSLPVAESNPFLTIPQDPAPANPSSTSMPPAWTPTSPPVTEVPNPLAPEPIPTFTQPTPEPFMTPPIPSPTPIFGQPNQTSINNDYNPVIPNPTLTTEPQLPPMPTTLPPSSLPPEQPFTPPTAPIPTFEPALSNPPMAEQATMDQHLQNSGILPAVDQEPQGAPVNSMDQAPTDLSHLIDNSSAPNGEPPPSGYTPPLTQPETLVIPADGSPVVPNIPTQETNHKIPKWVIGVGVALLIAVVGASAYFILGIGQKTETTSIPATTAPQTQTNLQPPPQAQVPIPQPTTAPQTSTFGALEGSGTPAATSAAELIRQRQQQGR